jgi:transcriptional regulator with XRE-family HTH domain
MYSNQQKRSDNQVQALRKEAGRWLQHLRVEAGLSQREMAKLIGAEYYTFISQLECGRGRIPPDKYDVWAKALNISQRLFVFNLMRFYDPVTFKALFGEDGKDAKTVCSELEVLSTPQ